MTDTYTCSNCQAIHEVIWRDTPYPDRHRESCRNCGVELINQKTAGEIVSVKLLKKRKK